jgi:hypothetical protein
MRTTIFTKEKKENKERNGQKVNVSLSLNRKIASN